MHSGHPTPSRLLSLAFSEDQLAMHRHAVSDILMLLYAAVQLCTIVTEMTVPANQRF